MGRQLLPRIAVALVAIEHVYILVLEMFLWTKPLGLKTFGMTQELADATATLAANQGVYNGFLAAGLFWGLFTHNRLFKLFFLACVIVAGVFGAATAVPKIFFTQALPALIAMSLVLALDKPAASAAR
jgi:putative membrane protein